MSRNLDTCRFHCDTIPDPLPEIATDDTHFVCWLAIMPAAETIAEQLGELPLGEKL